MESLAHPARANRLALVLTDLQRRIRRIISDLPEFGAFALAGGGALIASGIVQRPTKDLDFFAPHPNDVTELYKAARAALEADGLKVTVWRVEATFARLQIESGTDSTAIDLATDYRLLPPQATAEGPILATQELAADKVLALEARAEARDYVDFQSLARRFSITELCVFAGQKDLGFRPERLLRALAQFDEIEPSEFDDYTPDYPSLRASISLARTQLARQIDERSLTDTSSESRGDIDFGL